MIIIVRTATYPDIVLSGDDITLSLINHILQAAFQSLTKPTTKTKE